VKLVLLDALSTHVETATCVKMVMSNIA